MKLKALTDAGEFGLTLLGNKSGPPTSSVAADGQPRNPPQPPATNSQPEMTSVRPREQLVSAPPAASTTVASVAGANDGTNHRAIERSGETPLNGTLTSSGIAQEFGLDVSSPNRDDAKIAQLVADFAEVNMANIFECQSLLPKT